MRAGPLLKCTLTEAVELGCHDNLLDYLAQVRNGHGGPVCVCVCVVWVWVWVGRWGGQGGAGASRRCPQQPPPLRHALHTQVLYGAPPGAASSRAFPPIDAGDFPYNAEGNASWAAYIATPAGATFDTRYTGENDINLVDVIQKANGLSALTVWDGVPGSGSLLTPVTGSYTGLRFAPLAEVFPDYENAPSTQVRVAGVL